MTSAAIDWSQFWQPIINALPALVVAFLGFLTVFLGSAALMIRSTVKNTWDKEKFFLEMQKSNNEELNKLREDQRQSDRREIELRDEIRQVRVDGDRKLGEAVAESDQKMAEMKTDYESKISDLKAIIADLEKQLEAKEAELQQERQARKDAEAARTLAEAQRDEKIAQFEQKIAALEKQVEAQKSDTAELKAAQEKPGE